MGKVLIDSRGNYTVTVGTPSRSLEVTQGPARTRRSTIVAYACGMALEEEPARGAALCQTPTVCRLGLGGLSGCLTTPSSFGVDRCFL